MIFGITKRLLVFVIIILIFLFYWFALRPGNIRSKCLKNARVEAVSTITSDREPNGYEREKLQEQYMNQSYESCLHEKGLKK